MRRAYTEALRSVFSEVLERACPQFQVVEKHAAPTVYPGERAFCHRVSDTLYHWVALVPDQKREAFYVEIGWSRKGRFPQLTMRPSLLSSVEAGSEDECLVRLGGLSRSSDFGWSIEDIPEDASQQEMMAYLVAQTRPINPELARTRVTPWVEKAVGELVLIGLPFLRKNSPPGAEGDVR